MVASISFTLGANLENLSLTGIANLKGTGNTLDNSIFGNDGNNLLLGAVGNDTLNGEEGNDTLDGGTGADEMTGGIGNDTYLVDNVGDKAIEALGEASIRSYSSVSFTLGANIERLQLTGIAKIDGTGNDLDNEILGNAAANKLTGADGVDTLDGGAGNDSLSGGNANDILIGGTGADTMEGGDSGDQYFVDNAGDVVTEEIGKGIDYVVASVSYKLGANVENLNLTGAANINGTGNDDGNTLVGNDGNNLLSGGGGNDFIFAFKGNDTLDGGTGNDDLHGGEGNDLYLVDDLKDTVTEGANEGTDAVQSSVTFTLDANIENLILTGKDAVNGTGNGGNNDIIGNDNNNILTDGAGNDTLDGGKGDDTIIGGIDNDILAGGIGNDVLDGGTGNDKMTGGDGDDQYFVDSAGDTVTEAAKAGLDRVTSSISFVLGANIEELILNGSSLDGTGNEIANFIFAASGNNKLLGLGGNDTLEIGRRLRHARRRQRQRQDVGGPGQRRLLRRQHGRPDFRESQ